MISNRADNKTLRYFSLIWILLLIVVPLVPKLRWYEFGNIISIIIISFFVIGLIFPILIKPIYFVQATIAGFIGNIVSSIVISIIFYFVVFPIGLILKLSGKDLLNKKIDKKSESYWIKREKQPGSMKYQF